MDGRSMSKEGLTVDGGRGCPEGGGHAVREGVLEAAKQSGQATGTCEKCGSNVTVRRGS
jgi:hypothetical protein